MLGTSSDIEGKTSGTIPTFPYSRAGGATLSRRTGRRTSRYADATPSQPPTQTNRPRCTCLGLTAFPPTKGTITRQRGVGSSGRRQAGLPARQGSRRRRSGASTKHTRQGTGYRRKENQTAGTRRTPTPCPTDNREGARNDTTGGYRRHRAFPPSPSKAHGGV